MRPPRQQQMAGLAAEKGHRLRGLDRHPHDGAGRTVDTAWQIYGDNPDFCGVHRFDHGARLASHLPIEPGAEQRVDDQIGRGKLAGRGAIGRAGPTFGSIPRVALEPRTLAHQADPHLVAALGQEPRCYEPVTAVVAGPGDDDNAPPRQGRRLFGNSAAGVLHQLRARHASGNRKPVGLGHFGGRQQLQHQGHPIGAKKGGQMWLMRCAATFLWPLAKGYACCLIARQGHLASLPFKLLHRV